MLIYILFAHSISILKQLSYFNFAVPQNTEFRLSFIVQPKKTSVNKADFITQTVRFNLLVKMGPTWMTLTGCGN